MNVLVDGFVFENTYQKGIRRYMEELLRRVDVPFSILLENPAAGQFPENWPVVGPLGPSPNSRFNLPARWKYRERAKQWRKEIQSHSVFHTSYFRQCPIPGIPSVVVVHDMVCEVMPHLFAKDPSLEISMKREAFEKADAIIAISENTKRDFHSFYPEFQNKVSVIPHGADHFIDDGIRPQQTKFQIREPFALFVGDRVGYKNFHALIDAVAEQSWPKDLDLWVAGPKFSPAEMAAIKYRGLSERIQHVGLVNEAELNWLYRHSTCFVFPSLFEGFGFPILEAQVRHAPVVANDMAVFHEVGGDAFLPCDCRNPALIAKAVSDLTHAGRRESLIQAGLENVKRYTWAETARKTKAVWESVARF
ncbi:MAG: glycosyltransferase family 1 protein [Verrucomicrobia bacterium]|nr:glycosyltransferase family 1 protein [Verrucomicrobiota bacterium]